ncbi:UBC-like protein [Coniophora puteana RWD-64-598 SS2]|uniref:UBC-like protein n=1 Tax=Coniophora puteana (strain RWD-64-598) TaxID=741705 RepID=A0A5M3N2K7_CONPW|nr:UBC-like protein [Coniophora puteana RWD-64-598 SS2]EIW85254.1 UBC-like protein [Coniophora puteana RWD-64-598 SS2]
MPTLNKNNAAVKRIMQEAKELANDPCTDYSAAPLEDDIFEWHCTLRGPAGTEFEGGIYHFRIMLPAEYPFRPPSIMLLTPNGRFELNTKICISFTSYHEEEWQPAWGVRTAIIGLQGFFPLKGQAAAGVGSVEYPMSERKRLAQLSRDWKCPKCQQTNLECLPDPHTAPTDKTGDAIQSTEDNVAVNEEAPGRAGTAPEASDAPRTITNSAIGTVADRDNLVPVGEVETAEDRKESNQSQVDGSSAPMLVENAIRGGVVRAADRGSSRPTLLLDTAICVLLALVLGLVCRRML